jgi:hypothetical protein
MLFMIAGHPRSGTTMLFRILRAHPEIGCTDEFKCLWKIDVPAKKHLAHVQWRWYRKSVLVRNGKRLSPGNWLRSAYFCYRYASCIYQRTQGRTVSWADVEWALQESHQKRVVGDKFPRYVFRLEDFIDVPDLKRILIYRDGRDVVSSYLQKIRTVWKRNPLVQAEHPATILAQSWVEAMGKMEQHKAHLHILRYDDFVREPEPHLASLAAYLGVDPAGFRSNFVRTDSISKHKINLSAEEQEEVMRVAGLTLLQYGYV